VHRKYRYSGHAQLLGGAAANLPPPPPSEEDIPLPSQDDIKLKEAPKLVKGRSQGAIPARRPDLKKDKEKDPLKSLFVTDATATNKTDPEIKKWGWLAEEADASRQLLQSYRKPNSEEEGWTNSLAGRSATNESRRLNIGSLKGNVYEPVGAEHAKTSNVERLVEDRAVREAEQRKQEELRQKAAQKESVNMAGKGELPPLMSSTNETLGLTRSHRKDDERSDNTMDADFSQTRKAMADITSRYQLNLTMADMVRRPVAPPPDVAAGRTLAARNTADKEGPSSLRGEARRPSMAGEATAGMATTPRTPTTMPGSGSAWMKPPSGPMPAVSSASAMVEGPKAPKASDMQAAAMFAPSAAPQNTPSTYTPQPAYAPASSLPGHYTPGNRSSGSLAPTFKPTAPYRSLFDNSASR
jgi:hypothetical protein